jgi:hypothetical protein
MLPPLSNISYCILEWATGTSHKQQGILITSPVEWTMGLILVKMTRLNSLWMGLQTASEALGDWYFERLTATDAAIDCRYPCNPACGFFNRSPGKPSFRKWSRT